MRAAALKRFSDELFQLNWISISAATATPTVGTGGLRGAQRALILPVGLRSSTGITGEKKIQFVH